MAKDHKRAERIEIMRYGEPGAIPSLALALLLALSSSGCIDSLNPELSDKTDASNIQETFELRYDANLLVQEVAGIQQGAGFGGNCRHVAPSAWVLAAQAQFSWDAELIGERLRAAAWLSNPGGIQFVADATGTSPITLEWSSSEAPDYWSSSETTPSHGLFIAIGGVNDTAASRADVSFALRGEYVAEKELHEFAISGATCQF